MLLKIARVQKSNGTEGEVVVNFHGISPEDIDIKDPVFIHFDGLPVPFFFESFARKGNTKAFVRLTGITSLADADEISGKFIYADSANVDIVPDEGDFSFLEGWTLTDRNGCIKGTVSGFLDIPNNPCLEIATPTGNVIMPLHDDLISDIDETARILSMNIPEGLFPEK